MKKILFPVIALLTITFMSSCGPTPEDGVKYNDKLIGALNMVSDAENTFIDALDKDSAEMQTAYKKLVETVGKSMDEVKKIGSFDGKTDFMDQTMKYLSAYKGVVENEYKGMLDILSKPTEEFADDDKTKYDEMMDAADKKLNTASDEFDNFQKDFAKRYKFEIEERKETTK